MNIEYKKCLRCGEVYNKNYFHFSSRNKDGVASYCKSCSRQLYLNRSRNMVGLSMQIFYSQRTSSKRRGFPAPTYDRYELSEWMLNNKDYQRVFKDWVESGYKHELKPSCDRINDYGYYTLDNLQVLTWDQNRRKSWNDKINGINNKQSKTVIQMTRSGDFIGSHYSVQQAYRNTGIDYRSITSVCHGRRPTAGGFKWKFE